MYNSSRQAPATMADRRDNPQRTLEDGFDELPSYDMIVRDIEGAPNLSLAFSPDFSGAQNDAISHPDKTERYISANPTGEEASRNLSRTTSMGSMDTLQYANRQFIDFDGIHYAADLHGADPPVQLKEGNAPTRIARPLSTFEPMITEDMIFYPAPVPRTLNLPKRLSQAAPAVIKERRKTEFLPPIDRSISTFSFIKPDNEHPSETEPAVNDAILAARAQRSANRRSERLSRLPPQLRASLFFEQPPVTQKIHIQGNSARMTLEGILEASTSAPVSAFTDHPIIGPMGSEVYGRDVNGPKSRPRRESDEARKRLSVPAHVFMSKTVNRNSILNDTSLGGNSLQADTVHGDTPRSFVANSLSGLPADAELAPSPLLNTEHEDSPDGAADQDGDEIDYMQQLSSSNFKAPTTLLAELQIRKQQQRQRTRPTATILPNSMRSSLLELDAVAEVEKRLRMERRVTLAWQDSDAADIAGQRDSEDEEIPLGILLAKHSNPRARECGIGLRNSNQHVGLIAERELEENESLSQRHDRLLGIAPTKRMTYIGATRKAHLATDRRSSSLPRPDNEDGEETLAQRLRLLKSRQALDDVVSDARTSRMSSDFASELLGQFGSSGELQSDKGLPRAESQNEDDGPGEENLAQRRRRLRGLSKVIARKGDTSRTPLQPHTRALPEQYTGRMSSVGVFGG